mmetsp:Transcript_16111/g.48271  ORF Transcript_16111/g.48271 Transcript_16111/m.48271 type:complete len:221 (-) Transcript_16111:305-967(-)
MYEATPRIGYQPHQPECTTVLKQCLREPACTPSLQSIVIFVRVRLSLLRRKFEVNLICIIPMQCVSGKAALCRNVYHFQGASNDATEQLAIRQLAASLWQFDEIDEQVVFKHQSAFCVICIPVDDCGCRVQKHLESHLGNVLRRFFKIAAFSDACICQKFVNQTDAHVIAHNVQLLVDLIHVFKIRDELTHDRSIRQTQNFGVDCFHVEERYRLCCRCSC